MPRILKGLKDYVEKNYEFLDIEDGLEKVGDKADFTAQTYIFGGRFASGSMHAALYDLDQSLPEPSLLYHFLARIFVTASDMHGECVAIGSPIAVWTEPM